MHSDIRSFKDLDAWKVSIELALISYELAKRLPLTERFELSAQIRRAAVSPRTSRRAKRSDFEIARRLGMLSSDDLAELNAHIARSGQLLHGLARSLRFRLRTQATRCLAVLGLLPIGYLFLTKMV